MLFRKHIDPRCAYCVHGGTISETQVICIKRGVVAAGDRCGSFRYDPLRRQPQRPVAPRAGAPIGAPQKAAPKVGRNDPCPCGSGKKYKKCCGLVAEDDSAPKA